MYTVGRALVPTNRFSHQSLGPRILDNEKLVQRRIEHFKHHRGSYNLLVGIGDAAPLPLGPFEI